MRIISGSAGGKTLKVPDEVARPTTDRIRQALFSILGDLVAEARVLDLYAGSGALGLEALSRGAASAVFIDSSAIACAVIRKNLVNCKLAEKGTVRQVDAGTSLHEMLRREDQFDLIFADPPYFIRHGDDDLVAELLDHEALPQILAPDGYLSVEHSGRADLETENFELRMSRKYGRGRIEIFQAAEPGDGAPTEDTP